MSSKIRKMDNEKLKKYLRIINKCFILSLIALLIVVIFLIGFTIFKRGNGNENEMSILAAIILSAILIASIAFIFEKISDNILKEFSRRKDNETIAILSSTGTKKIKLNDFEDINLNELLEISETEAVYDSETDIILITFIITGDDGSTKISKTVEFKKDDIISKIEII